MKKHTMTAILAAAVLAFGACAPIADTESTKTPGPTAAVTVTSAPGDGAEDAYAYMDMTKALVCDETGIYQMLGRQIIYTPVDGEVKTIALDALVDTDEVVDRNVEGALAKADGKLYVIVNNYVFPVTDAVQVRLLALDTDGALLQSYDLPVANAVNTHFDKLEVIDNTVFIKASRASRVEGLYTFNMETGSLDRIEEQRVNAMATMGDKILYCKQSPDFDTVLYVYDPAADKVESEHTINRTRVVDMGYDETTQILYGLSDNQLFTFDLDTDELTNLYQFAKFDPMEVDLLTVMAVYGDKLAAIQKGGSMVFVENVASDWSAEDTLTIYCYSSKEIMTPAMNRAIGGMLAKHPMFRVNFVETNEYNVYRQMLASRLMARDVDFDLFVIEQANMPVVEKRFFRNLADFEGIAANFDQMLPGIKELFSADGQIFGAPIAMPVGGLSYDTATLEAYGLAAPTAGWTSDDYLQMLTGANDAFANTSESIGAVSFFDFYIGVADSFYWGEDVTLSDMVRLYETTLAIWQAGGIELSTDIDIQGVFADERPTMFMTEFDYWNIAPTPVTREKAMNPLFDADARYSVMITALAINLDSPKQDLAAEFLELLTSKETEDALLADSIWRYDNRHLSVGSVPYATKEEMASPAYKLAAEKSANYSYLYEREAMMAEPGYQLYKEALYRSIADRCYHWELNVFARESFEAVTRGETTPQAAAEAVYKRMLLMRDE